MDNVKRETSELSSESEQQSCDMPPVWQQGLFNQLTPYYIVLLPHDSNGALAYSQWAMPLNANRAASTVQSEEVERKRAVEEFARQLKQRRLQLGLTQEEVSDSLSAYYATQYSQTMISHIEAAQISYRHMLQIRSPIEAWFMAAELERMKECNLMPMQMPHGAVGLPMPSTLAFPHETGHGMTNFMARPGELEKPRKRRSPRTVFTRDALSILEMHYAKNPKPSMEKCKSIAEELDLGVEVVMRWFGNRRQKTRREMKAK